MSTLAQSLSTLEENKRLTVRWFEEVWNKARREAIAEMFAENAVLHEHGTDCCGPREFAQRYDAFRERFSGFSAKPVVTLAEGDLAALHWSADFVETSTGKRVHVTGTSIARCQNGQIIEAWQNWDEASIAAQLTA
jgi:predicted SnoaL-like aldol condensation-catalyzing enzyme